MSGLDRTMDLLESPGSAQGHASKYAGQSWPGLRFNEHMEGDGPTIFAHACKMGLKDIVSKGKDSIYRSGRSTDWLKFKNPPAPPVTAWGCRAHPCNISNNPPRLRATTSSPYGADYAMPNLLNHLAAPSCSRLGSHWDYVEPKGAIIRVAISD
jgi:hypothetical protein